MAPLLPPDEALVLLDHVLMTIDNMPEITWRLSSTAEVADPDVPGMLWFATMRLLPGSFHSRDIGTWTVTLRAAAHYLEWHDDHWVIVRWDEDTGHWIGTYEGPRLQK